VGPDVRVDGGHEVQRFRQRGDYLLAVKSNQPAVLDDLKLFFEGTDERRHLERFETTDGDHDRIELRRHWVCNDVQWLRERHQWKGPNSIAMVEASREIDGKATVSRGFYISSTQLDTKGFAAAVRSHWTIENQLHRPLDVVLHDDLSRLRSENGPQNMATIRHAALNLLGQTKDKASLKRRRRKAAWSADYLEALLRGLA